jgi:hypothetical protein
MSPLSLVPTPALGRICSALLLSNFVEEKRKSKKEKHDIFVYLR